MGTACTRGALRRIGRSAAGANTSATKDVTTAGAAVPAPAAGLPRSTTGIGGSRGARAALRRVATAAEPVDAVVRQAAHRAQGVDVCSAAGVAAYRAADACAVAHTSPALACSPRGAGVAAGAAVVGIGLEVDARTRAATQPSGTLCVVFAPAAMTKIANRLSWRACIAARSAVLRIALDAFALPATAHLVRLALLRAHAEGDVAAAYRAAVEALAAAARESVGA